MNSKQNLSNETNNPQSNIINFNPTHGSENTNSILLPNINSSKTPNTEEKKELIEKNNGSTVITPLEKEMKCNSIAATSKSLINVQDKIIPGSNIFINNFKNNSSNPFINQLNSEPNSNIKNTNNFNQNLTSNDGNNFKKNKSQFIRNSININPKEINKFSNEINNSIIRIKVYKSHNKHRRTTQYIGIDNKNILLNLENEINNKKNEKKIEVSDFNDKKYKYKLLIKRIAEQLKRKINPPTKGYFYVTIIKTDRYLKIIKKIGQKLKIGVHPPTHGFFYNFIEKENKYKLLIKRIGSQLKKKNKITNL